LSRTISLRPEARRDIAAIWTYTEEHWGETQADGYADETERKFNAVADNPGLGSDCSELYPGLRRIKCGSHLIYYLTSGQVLDVVRILHARRDAEQEF
jgi:toxin ParE1/3/4